MPTENDYDLREAMERLVRHGLDTGDRDAFDAAHEANRIFLAALARLNVYGFHVTIDDDRAMFVTPDGTRVDVAYSPSGASCYQLAVTRRRIASVREPKYAPLAVVFDPTSTMFCGTTIDERIVPEPGKPRPMRSAVAVVVEAVLKAIRAEQ